MYYTEQGFYRLIFNAPIFLFGLFQLKKAIKLLFFDTIKKDFEQKKKIKITLIVSKKNEEHESFDGPNSSANIEFKKNPYFRSLDISESSYLSISIGDKVNFELSKYGKWLIKVNSNSRNIDYNTLVHDKNDINH